VVQLGTSTVESRGIEIISIRDRSPEMCMTMVVSDRAPASSPPARSRLSPPRESLPMITMFNGVPAFGSFGSTILGRSGPRTVIWPVSMFPVSWVTAATPPAVASETATTSTITTARAAPLIPFSVRA
jgi:hypothetical protein